MYLPNVAPRIHLFLTKIFLLDINSKYDNNIEVEYHFIRIKWTLWYDSVKRILYVVYDLKYQKYDSSNSANFLKGF